MAQRMGLGQSSHRTTVTRAAVEAERERYRRARERMVVRIRDGGILDEGVLDALSRLERHLLVPQGLQDRAYEDVPLPIGSGQTISAPSIVGFMSSALRLSGTERVLEIGTGSAYQTAVLSLLADRVVSIERISSLANSARKNLELLGINNAVVHVGDGTRGRPVDGPYDAIVVTAAGPDVPTPLLKQLTKKGRLVGPFGDRDNQRLVHIKRDSLGDWSTKDLGGCRFVDLVGIYGWKE